MFLINLADFKSIVIVLLLGIAMLIAFMLIMKLTKYLLDKYKPKIVDKAQILNLIYIYVYEHPHCSIEDIKDSIKLDVNQEIIEEVVKDMLEHKIINDSNNSYTIINDK